MKWIKVKTSLIRFDDCGDEGMFLYICLTVWPDDQIICLIFCRLQLWNLTNSILKLPKLALNFAKYLMTHWKWPKWRNFAQNWLRCCWATHTLITTVIKCTSHLKNVCNYETKSRSNIFMTLSELLWTTNYQRAHFRAPQIAQFCKIKSFFGALKKRFFRRSNCNSCVSLENVLMKSAAS